MFLRPILRRFCTYQQYQLPPLDYAYDALQPIISKQQLETHHKKHHQTYVNNLNLSLQTIPQNNDDPNQYNDPSIDLNSVAKNAYFNLGGHINHSIYWKNLSPVNKEGGQLPNKDSNFSKQVIDQFGSFERLIDELSKKTIGIKGSGWGWLALDDTTKVLRILQLPNQETLVPQKLIPLLTIDAWEHAYYIDYKNARAQYVKNIWQIINWKQVESRYNEAIIQS